MLKFHDRVRGILVNEDEYIDIQNMMEKVRLAEMDNVGDYDTCSNKQIDSIIYSRIDRVLANLNCLQKNMGSSLTVMAPNVFDHALLSLKGQEQNNNRRYHFKYNNCIAKINVFHTTVEKN